MSRYFHPSGANKKRSRYFGTGKPGPSTDAAQTDEMTIEKGSPCTCGQGTMQPRDGRYGPFWGCSAFPACRRTVHIGERSGAPRAARTLARLEMETESTVRCWSTDATPAVQAQLRASLDAVTVAPCGTEPRADWSAASAISRATSVYRLADYDAVLQQLCGASGGDGSSGGEGTSEGAMAVRPIPASTLRFYRHRLAAPTDAAEVAARDSAVGAQMGQLPARLRASLLPFQRSGVERLLRWEGRGLLADESDPHDARTPGLVRSATLPCSPSVPPSLRPSVAQSHLRCRLRCRPRALSHPPLALCVGQWASARPARRLPTSVRCNLGQLSSSYRPRCASCGRRSSRFGCPSCSARTTST